MIFDRKSDSTFLINWLSDPFLHAFKGSVRPSVRPIEGLSARALYLWFKQDERSCNVTTNFNNPLRVNIRLIGPGHLLIAIVEHVLDICTAKAHKSFPTSQFLHSFFLEFSGEHCLFSYRLTLIFQNYTSLERIINT